MAGGGVSLTLSLIYWKDSVPTYQGNSGENLNFFLSGKSENNGVFSLNQINSVGQAVRQLCTKGPIHTGRAGATQANGTSWYEWECPHCSNIKGIAFEFACSRPVWIGP